MERLYLQKTRDYLETLLKESHRYDLTARILSILNHLKEAATLWENVEIHITQKNKKAKEKEYALYAQKKKLIEQLCEALEETLRRLS